MSDIRRQLADHLDFYAELGVSGVNRQAGWSRRGADAPSPSSSNSLEPSIQMPEQSLIQVARSSEEAHPSPVQDEGIAWSPDGTRLVFAVPRDNAEDDRESNHTVRADGSAMERLTASATYDVEPAWGP